MNRVRVLLLAAVLLLTAGCGAATADTGAEDRDGNEATEVMSDAVYTVHSLGQTGTLSSFVEVVSTGDVTVHRLCTSYRAYKAGGLSCETIDATVAEVLIDAAS